MSEGNKIVFKASRRGGVDKSFNNLEALSSVKMVINKITLPIFKIRGKAFIGLKERMDDGDIIEAGLYKVLYRILHHEKVSHEGNIYWIERVDAASITSFDITQTKKDQKVIIKNRKSFEQMFKDFEIYNDKDE